MKPKSSLEVFSEERKVMNLELLSLVRRNVSSACVEISMLTGCNELKTELLPALST